MEIVAVNPNKGIRNSNLELLRILAMLAIIAHHYVVNSGVTEYFNYTNVSSQQMFLELWGAWGKTAINSFILISGYFMCTMRLTWQRYLKLLLEILFYEIVIMLIFGLCGYEPLSPKLIFRCIFGLAININNGFTASFMVFYIFVPFYNVLIRNISRLELMWLLIGLLTVMTISATFFFARTMNEPLWYMTLYFVASFIRLYPSKYFNDLKLWVLILTFSLVLAVSSICFLVNYGNMMNFNTDMVKNFFVHDSNKIFAFLIGLSAFMVAKNIRPFYSRFINVVAAGTFGVLLIHAASDTMRQWLWRDVFNVPGMFNAELPVLLVHAFMAPLVIFSVCSFIDYFRRRFLEKPLFNIIMSRGREWNKG